MDSPLIPVVIAVLTIVINIVYFSIWGTWKIAGVKEEIVSVIFNHKKEVAEAIDLNERALGETIQAMRQKLSDVELYVRDHFVRNEEFTRAIERFETNSETASKSLEARLLRMEGKLDTAAKRL